MCRLESHALSRFYQPIFQLENSFSAPKPCLQFTHVARLCQVVVRARLQSFYNLLLASL
jgi:hypothetical protein